ncbi:MAG: DUF1841 family protein [Thermacetogeniaceae bacterium]
MAKGKNNPFGLDGFGTDEMDAGVETVLNEHPEVKILFERRHKLPSSIEINGVNPILHVLLEGAVENQLHDPEIPEVKRAVERLEGKGLSRHAARGCVTRLFIEFFYEAFSQKKAFDKERYRCQLNFLGADVSGVGRNDPCPCGSGLKFKKCCGKAPENFQISKMAGLLSLGTGAYIFGPPELIVRDPLDPIMQLENRVHIARYLEENGDIQGARRCLEENVALAESYQGGKWLKNALEDLQLFCLNNKPLWRDGISVTERLIALSESDEEKGNFWADKADLLALMGRVKEAEQEFQNLFQALPDWHFGRYRYALFLKEIGRKKEALAVLRELVAAKRKIDRETYQCARDVLRDWERE